MEERFEVEVNCYGFVRGESLYSSWTSGGKMEANACENEVRDGGTLGNG